MKLSKTLARCKMMRLKDLGNSQRRNKSLWMLNRSNVSWLVLIRSKLTLMRKTCSAWGFSPRLRFRNSSWRKKEIFSKTKYLVSRIKSLPSVLNYKSHRPTWKVHSNRLYCSLSSQIRHQKKVLLKKFLWWKRDWWRQSKNQMVWDYCCRGRLSKSLS